jgi:hypothetical protein
VSAPEFSGKKIFTQHILDDTLSIYLND